MRPRLTGYLRMTISGHRKAQVPFFAVLTVTALLIYGSPALAQHPKGKVVEIKLRPIDPKEAGAVSFARQIKPILVDNCFECHSTKDHKGGLDATTANRLIQGGKKASPAIIP